MASGIASRRELVSRISPRACGEGLEGDSW
jgi:hypothetical protein